MSKQHYWSSGARREGLISQLITLLALPHHKHSRWDSIKSPSLLHRLSSAGCSTCIRLHHVSYDRLLKLPFTVCTWFEFTFLLLPFAFSVLFYVPLCSSLFSLSVCHQWIGCRRYRKPQETSFISFNPPITCFAPGVAPHVVSFSSPGIWHLHVHITLMWSISQSCDNGAVVADMLDSVRRNGRLSSHLKKCRIF